MRNQGIAFIALCSSRVMRSLQCQPPVLHGNMHDGHCNSILAIVMADVFVTVNVQIAVLAVPASQS